MTTFGAFKYTVRGHNRVANNMRARVANCKNTDPVVRKWAQKVRTKLNRKPYPPKRPGQRYKRTGRLGSSWKASNRGGKNAYVIENTATRRGRPYPMWVVGDATGKRQAWMHKGRWWIAREVIEEDVPELRKDLLKYCIDV